MLISTNNGLININPIPIKPNIKKIMNFNEIFKGSSIEDSVVYSLDLYLLVIRIKKKIGFIIFSIECLFPSLNHPHLHQL